MTGETRETRMTRAARTAGRAGAAAVLLLGCLLAGAPSARAERETSEFNLKDWSNHREWSEWSRTDWSRPEWSGWAVGRTPEVFRERQGIATRVGGWFDASYEDNDLPRARRSLNVNHFNLFFDTRFRDRWQAFLEVEMENESDLTGFREASGYHVQQAYGRYWWSDNFEIQVGRFNTPFGFWTPIHWTILMDSVRAPIHENQRVIPEHQQGLAFVGHLFGDDQSRVAELRYSLFGGYGSNSPGQKGAAEGVSVGADVRLSSHRGDFLGLSYYQQRREEPADRSERNLSLYSKVSLSQQFSVLAEYVLQMRDATEGGDFDRRLNIAYTTLHWQFHPKLYLSYRFNWGDSDSDIQTDQRQIHTVTLGYSPTRSLRVKLELADHGFRGGSRRAFRYWAASVGGLF